MKLIASFVVKPFRHNLLKEQSVRKQTHPGGSVSIFVISSEKRGGLVVNSVRVMGLRTKLPLAYHSLL